MISNPQEIEQEAIAIANWIAYNGRPFIIPTSDGTRAVLCLMSEQAYRDAIEPKETAPADTTAPASDDA